MSQ
ncbi:hypothetical protein D020_3569A, partial [Vibrio parahaemolyticus SBR10290]|jgi:hypothetical protein